MLAEEKTMDSKSHGLTFSLDDHKGEVVPDVCAGQGARGLPLSGGVPFEEFVDHKGTAVERR